MQEPRETVKPAGPVQEPEAAWQEFTRVLDRDEREVDGKLLKRGTKVLCHPARPEIFREDTLPNRQEFLRRDRTWTLDVRQDVWFPALAGMPSDLAGLVEESRSAKETFLAAIDENMLQAKEQPVPEVRSLPFWFALLAWEPKIREVTRVADLSDALATLMVRSSGVPSELDWPEGWKRQLTNLNEMRVYALRGMTTTVHVAAAFATGLRFRPGKYPELLPPDQDVVDAVQQVFQDWAGSSRAHRSHCVFFTVGASCPWPPHMAGQSAGDRWLILSHLSSEGAWETKAPPRPTDRLSLRDFLDRLKPETQQQRVVRIKEYIDGLLASGYGGSIHLAKIAEETGYRRTAVRSVLVALQDSGHYRLYKTGDGLMAVERATAKVEQWGALTTFRQSIVPHLAFLAPALGVGLWSAREVVTGKPFKTLTFVLLLTLAYAGEWLKVYVRKFREEKE